MSFEAKIAINLAKKYPGGTLGMVKSMILGKPRDLIGDCDWVVQNLEHSEVKEVENIPNNHEPLIIACNHPEVYDQLLGAARVTQVLAQQRSAIDLPGEVRWMVAENLASPNHFKPTLFHRASSLLIARIHKNYNFIPVPINYNDPTKKRFERAQVLRKTRAHLKDESGSKILGIFPEGDYEHGDMLLDFHHGIGVLSRMSPTLNISILPTGIYRDNIGQLTIEFGQPILIGKESSERVTEKVRSAVSFVSRKRI